MKPKHRRHFLHRSLAAALATPAVLTAATAKRPPRILLRSAWQVVNIGDIAHTPGMLALLEKHPPDAEARLWASGDLTGQVAAMEHRRFPRLKIVKGSIGANGLICPTLRGLLLSSLFVDQPAQLAQQIGAEEGATSADRDHQIGLVNIRPLKWQRKQTPFCIQIRDAILTPVVAHREEIEALSS